MKAQISLWMLTKFAILFFIFGLVILMTAFGNRASNAICETQANAVAKGIAAAITSVIHNPVEDERLVYPLESVLSIGGTEVSEYQVNITHLITSISPKGETTGRFSISVIPRATNCRGGASVPYENLSVLIKAERSKIINPKISTIELWPSKLAPEKTYSIVILKCTSKNPDRKKYLFITDCRKEDPDTRECSSFENKTIAKCCAWHCFGPELGKTNRTCCPGETYCNPGDGDSC